MDDNTPARLSALEAQVATLAELLGMTIAAVGTLNAHVSLAISPGDSLKEARERKEEIEANLADLYKKLSAYWPEPD